MRLLMRNALPLRKIQGVMKCKRMHKQAVLARRQIYDFFLLRFSYLLLLLRFGFPFFAFHNFPPYLRITQKTDQFD